MLTRYMHRYQCVAISKPEPIMLLVLPMIPSRISHNFYPLFFYSHAITYYSCYILLNFYCVSDNEVSVYLVADK